MIAETFIGCRKRTVGIGHSATVKMFFWPVRSGADVRGVKASGLYNGSMTLEL